MRAYSFKDLSGAITHPAVGTFRLSGKIGMGTLTVINSTERTTISTAADGTPMMSAVAGNSGQVTIEMQQNSGLHRFLLTLFNAIATALDNGDATDWGSGRMTLRSVSDGTGHIVNGFAPSKTPDKPYAAQGQNVTWTLMAGDIQNIAA